MNDFDQIMANANSNATKSNKSFDKNAWRERKQQERQEVYDLMDKTADEIKTDINKYKQYLDVQGRFDKYSVGNALVISATYPNATQIKEFDDWKESGAFIKKGANGIKILEPGDSYTRSDGSSAISYNVKKMFDISQTTSTQKPRTINYDDRVKLIFKNYLDGHGCDYIAKLLIEMKVETRRNKGNWLPSTIMKILKNEKYVGDVLQGKTFTIDPISHKRLTNYGEADQYYMRNHHEPIIKREDFEKVQEIIKNRVGARATGRRLGNIGRKYTFSGKIKCGFCGNTYVRRAMYSKQGSTCIWDCLLNIRSGKESCENSKAMRENLLENVFVDAFHRLCNNQNMDKDQLIKIITSALRDDRNIEKVKSLEKEKINIEYQQQRLIDLMIDGTIDKESYNKKKVTFDNKKEKIDKEIEQYRLLTEDEDKVESGIKKIKEVIDSNKLLDGFDRDVFDALVDYIIIGGYENGKKDDCMIRFICKTQFDDTPREDLTKQKIIDNNDIMDYKCNSFINILDFYSNQQFFYFYVDENGKKRKKVINSVRVRVEVEK